MSDSVMTVAVAGRASRRMMLRKMFQRLARRPRLLRSTPRMDEAGDVDDRRQSDALPHVDKSNREQREAGVGSGYLVGG